MLSIAPMMGYTNRFFRNFMRIISKSAVLYTEMISANAVIHTKYKDSFLKYDDIQHPVGLQLGGSDPESLGLAAKLAADYQYDFINLNCGCPSPKVAKNSFGAVLMSNPELVGKICNVMKKNSKIPVSVKCRIGIMDSLSKKRNDMATIPQTSTDHDYEQEKNYYFVRNFIKTVHEISGVNSFVVHARCAILKKLNPKDNLHIPPLNYPVVYKLKEDFPHIDFTINGGINCIDSIESQIKNKMAGVMIGRLAIESPYEIAKISNHLYNHPLLSRSEILDQYCEYLANVQLRLADEQCTVSPFVLVKPILNLYKEMKGSNKYKRCIADALNNRSLGDDCLASLVKKASTFIES